MILRMTKPKLKPLFPKIILKSERLTLRPPAITDQAQWTETRTRNKTHIQPYEPTWSPHYTKADFWHARLNRQSREWELGLANAFLIFKDETLIGGMPINNICRGAAQFASIGYWIDQSHEGQGLMSEAIALTLNYAFKTLALHRINASCIPQNPRSKNTLLRAGFVEEGFAEKYLRINGKWQDHHLFGLNIDDWGKI